MLDLKPFCSTKAHVREIREPFPRGDFTYATNSHIMIRIPRRPEDAEVENAPHAEKLFDSTPLLPLGPLPAIKLPAPKVDDCPKCEGGTESVHSCPDCDCECDKCGGSGTIEAMTTCEVNGTIFDIKYVRLIQALPGVQFPTAPPKGQGARFTFDGGEGMVMPCASHATRYVRKNGTVCDPNAKTNRD